MKKLTAFLITAAVLVWGYFTAMKMYEDIKHKNLLDAYPIPDEYSSIAEYYSNLYEVPTELVYAVIRTESAFNKDAKSSAGAMGLMQITEDTFVWLQTKTKESLETDELYNPDINIRYGVFFLKMLYDEYNSWDIALAAYNAGRTNVNRWLNDSEITKDGKLENIPFEETKNYIEKVNSAKNMYYELYFKTDGENTDK